MNTQRTFKRNFDRSGYIRKSDEECLGEVTERNRFIEATFLSIQKEGDNIKSMATIDTLHYYYYRKTSLIVNHITYNCF